MVAVDESKYAHSPIHQAVILKDYVQLKTIIASLPKLKGPNEIHAESDSLAEEAKADARSAVIDLRDVPKRETPLHLAVKFSDASATEILMLAGADWSLQNEQGWNALQEAVCNREEQIARIIIRNYQPQAWAKWCRRLPRVIGTMQRMRDFYMEITFHFDSSVIPFVSRVAPSDTYRIWKRGANLRADMTLAGFDGFKIQRSEQSFLFLGDGSEDGKLPSGILCLVTHKDKEVMNALESAGAPASDAEVQHELKAMLRNNMFRPGLDVTQAILLPQMSSWKRKERTETVGQWKAKVYDMHNVVLSLKSRRVPGAMPDNESFSSKENDTDSEFEDVLTEDERHQLEAAIEMDAPESKPENGTEVLRHRHSSHDLGEIPIEDKRETAKRKGWFGSMRRGGSKREAERKTGARRSSSCVEEEFEKLQENVDKGNIDIGPERHSIDIELKRDENQVVKDTKVPLPNTESKNRRKDGNGENEYKKGLRPVLWLSSNFPLQTDELLPLLDILANKVKAIRRLRELLTTKLPRGTFPIRVAIPVVPTIRVIVTFTKFEELQSLDDFQTPPTSPTSSNGEEIANSSSSSMPQCTKSSGKNETDVFAIPSDYTWISAEAKRKMMKEKAKLKKGKGKK